MSISPFLLSTMLLLSSTQSLAESFRFDLSPNQPLPAIFSRSSNSYLIALKMQYELNEVVKGRTSDFERVLSIAHWTSTRWRHNGENTPQHSDPISILDEATTGKQFRCVEYAIVLAGALGAVGYPARVVGLMMADVETRSSGAGHVVTEVYLADLGKWVMVDGQWDVVPLVSGVPASAAELAQAITANPKYLSTESFSSIDAADYFKWIKPYLYYFTASLDNTYDSPRSRQAIRLAPLGAKEPRVFQRKYPMQPALFTHNVSTFYPAPTFVDETK
ncbi:transglutaminase family protein [Ideonella sp. B508-1]|uniref:transglutaminase-like domain-containing protein n=1 Tax=Ideonella sp. B508-1 TaxID=137716 RepID=UPI00131ED854|nr:transglutaminase-like domain-containing protein [Ideonella sp. B508-1]